MIRFVIFGEPASKANSREIVTFPIAGAVCPKCQAPKQRGDVACRQCGGSLTRPSSIKSKKARNYERDALKQIPPIARVRLQGPVKVTLRVFYASERPDLDESVILDVLQDRYKGKGEERVLVQKGVYLNDRQVREKHVFHAIDRKNPRTEVEVELLEPELFAPAPIHVEQPKRALAELAVEKDPF